eukprot:CAMPEP_0114634884 /NCGR_PEP_ID=MMETSP0168-20121206/16203_1 /TAXON_ID=95228 ORGANISM="Vannella sp., Strain DIVA3 517/6/12" /NCGR_SAMPLE_ID=MMETSP0168 /ASSEMBLY_ACC=CAM_ASM_000044 /LENGTH=210 /DNA_ID=CAMNT_0001846585 /DNA_START=116 /DNA_END=745 /DNA_ORIENTATION=+
MSLFIGRLNPDVRVEEIEGAFGKFGPLRRCDHKGSFAFVTFEDERDAEDAIRGLHNTEIGGARVNVEWARGGGKRSDFATSVERSATSRGTASSASALEVWATAAATPSLAALARAVVVSTMATAGEGARALGDTAGALLATGAPGGDTAGALAPGDTAGAPAPGDTAGALLATGAPGGDTAGALAPGDTAGAPAPGDTAGALLATGAPG